jgi:tetratricopeptide (TPR) repeat protein
VAQALLEVAERRADGTMQIGGRKIAVRRGVAVWVSPAAEDPELEAYLEFAGRVPSEVAAAASAARSRGESAWAVLSEHVPEKLLSHATERLWIERLARGIRDEEARGAEPPFFVHSAPTNDGRTEAPLVPLILDAFAQHATRGEAERVGEHARLHFEWDMTPHRDIAELWLGAEALPNPPVVSQMLSAAPASAPRIAALLRTGLAHLRSAGSALPPPPERPPSLPPLTGHRASARPPERTSRWPSNPPPANVTPLSERPAASVPSAPSLAEVPSERAHPSTLPPPKAASISFSPGRGTATRVVASLPPPTDLHTPLDDPMDSVERLIAALEQSGAPGGERAAAWREAARVFDSHFGALSEAARAFREAATADPDDRVAQREAALRCASLGQFRVARAYAEAGAELARTGKERAATLKRVAQLALWDHDVDDAIRALERALESDPTDITLHQRMWSVFVSEGRMDEATAAARAAADRLHAVEPSQARALLAWARERNPGDLEIATEHAVACAYDGYSEGAVAVLARDLGGMRGPGEDATELLVRAKSAIGTVSSAPGTPARRRGALALESRTEAAAVAIQAFDAELGGDGQRAKAFAWEALRLDPDQPVAALVLHAARESLEPRDRITVLNATRRVLGDSLSLAGEAEQDAARAHDNAALESAIETRFELAPQDAGVALSRLVFQIDRGSAGKIRAVLRDALNVDRFGDASACERALLELERLGDDVMDLGIRAVERLGHQAPSLLEWVVLRSERDPRPQMRVLALEHAFARARESDKAAVLVRLASHFRAAKEHAREARTLVRVLAVAPYHHETLERLSEIYAEAGEIERLMAVLSLRLECASHPDERAQRLRDLAAAALHIAGDRKRALGYVQSIIDEAGEDAIRVAFGIRALVALHKPADVVALLSEQALHRDARAAAPLWTHAVAIAETEGNDQALALRTAIKGLAQSPQTPALLLAFERLALESKEIEAARGVYRSLMDRAMGVHGRRALAYREARWLERAGDRGAALDAYSQAFALAPSAGVVIAAIERLAFELGEFEPFIAASVTLARQTSHVETRARLYERAAMLSEKELGSPKRAFDLYLAAWSETGSAVDKEHARRLAQRVAVQSPGDGAAAYSAFIEVLRARIEGSWDADEKVATLREIARLYAFDCGAPDLAIATVDEAVLVAERDAETTGLRPDILVEAAEWLLERFQKRDEAGVRVRRALALRPDHPRALALAEDLRLGTLSSGPMGKRPSFVPRIESSPSDQTLAGLRDRVSAGDLEAGEELARLLVDRGQAREGHRLLLSIVRREPERVKTIRELHALSAAIPVPAAEAVTGEILAMIDPTRTVRAARVLFQEGGVSTPYDRYLARRSRVLRVAWEHATKLYRMERAEVGIVGTDRVAYLGKTPIAVAYADAMRVIGVENEVELYTRRHENHKIFLVASRPPIAVINVRPDRDDLEDLDALRFRIGRALELARPEHILLAPAAVPAQEPTRARLLAAVVAAFSPGPRESTEGPVHPDPAVAAMASELWQQLPNAAQAEITALLTELDEPFDVDQVELATRCRAACTGLAVSGRIAPSVRGLVADDASLTGITVTSESEYIRACIQSRPFRALIRFGLSDEYLAAHAMTAALTP